MAYKRILLMQDISCVGQCSMTVALPILSACGHEACIFPTSILSTHTGGFGKPHVIHLNEDLDKMIQHWKANEITFDGILVGYLGSVFAVEAARKVMETMLAPEGIAIVDPAMADHGKLYSGFDEEYARAMESLCRSADIMLPNLTEAAMFAGMEYRENYDESYVLSILEKVNHPCVVLTGVGYSAGKTGIALYDAGKYHYIQHDRINRNFHGTGDMFAACFTGALMQGKAKVRAIDIACQFVLTSIYNTVQEPAHWYGVKFETALPDLISMIHQT